MSGAHEAPRSASRRGSRLLLAATAVLGLAGLALIAVALIPLLQPADGAAAQREPASAATGEAAAASPSDADGGSETAPADPEETPRAGIAALASRLWVAETAERLGIPERALAAYAGAEIALAAEQPGCGVDWATLAAIGHVESGHGTIHGGAIDDAGRQTPAVIGIALDGTLTNAIPDTDGGALDGDAVWDRAVGPMQLIPSTWALVASDGDGDGIADPQQIDDAVLSAARYLCSVGASLRAADGWVAAVAAYNDTVDYNHRVADATDHYRQG